MQVSKVYGPIIRPALLPWKPAHTRLLIGPVVVTVTADARSRDDTPHTSLPIDTGHKATRDVQQRCADCGLVRLRTLIRRIFFIDL